MWKVERQLAYYLGNKVEFIGCHKITLKIWFLFIFVKANFKILVNMLVKCQAILTWKLTFTDAYRQLSNLPFDTLNLAQWGELILEGIISFLCKSNLFKLQNFTTTIAHREGDTESQIQHDDF